MLLSHNSSLNDLFVSYCFWKHKVKSGEISEEYEHFELCKLNYQNCKSAIKTIKSRIGSLCEQISRREQEHKDCKTNALKDCEDSVGHSSQIEGKTKMKVNGKKDKGADCNDNDSVSSIGSNDGSATIDDLDMPLDQPVE